MKYCQNPEDAIPVMRIFDVVGERVDEVTYLPKGINGVDFATELSELDKLGKEKIEVHINSVGGSIVDGMTIYQAIKNMKTPCETVCVGIAVSIAGVILQAGSTRLMVAWGQMMIHNPSGGNVKELSKLKDTIIKMICPRTGISEEEMVDIMDDEKWYNYDECLELKLIDGEYVMQNDKEAEKAEMYSNKLLSIVNELTKPKNTMKSLIAALQAQGFNINDAANEGEILKCVNSLIKAKNEAEDYKNKCAEAEDAKNKAEDKLKKAEDAKKKAEDDMEEAKNEKKEAEDRMQKMEDAKKEAEDKVKVTEAENAIDLAIKSGKIKKELKAKWVDMYVADKELTVELLSGMNGVRTAANIESKPAGGTGGAKGSNVAAAMAEVRRKNQERIEKAQ